MTMAVSNQGPEAQPGECGRKKGLIVGLGNCREKEGCKEGGEDSKVEVGASNYLPNAREDPGCGDWEEEARESGG